MPIVSDYTALLSGDYWTGIERSATPVFITYSFPTNAPASHAGVPGIDYSSFEAFSASQKAQAVAALQQWASASGIIVLEVPPGEGQINFSLYNFPGASGPGSGGMAFNPFGNWNYISAAPGFTEAYFIDDTGSGVTDFSGDVFINKSNLTGPNFDIPTGLLLHEIGHALGLKHVNANFPGDTQQIVYSGLVLHDETVSPALDNTTQTVMSYNGGEPLTLGTLDVQAIQHIYGTNAQDGSQVASYSWDGTELTQTGFAAVNDVMRGISVRDVMSGDSGDDLMFGLGGNDNLDGGAGSDRLFGGTGNDTLVGGSGADTFYADLFHAGSAQSDVFSDFNANEDVIDLELFGPQNFYGPASVASLNLVLTDNAAGTAQLLALWNGFQQSITINYTGTLTAANFYMPSFGPRNVIGSAGDDTLFGGTENDTIEGGAGNDLFIGDAGSDTASFSSATNVSGVTVTLVAGGAVVVNAHGGGESDTLLSIENVIGSAYGDTISGDTAANTLTGGLGNDTLTGGSGGDTYVRDANDASGAQSDVVTDFSVAEDKIDLGTLGPASFEAARNWLIRSTEADTTSLGDTRLLSAWNSNLQTMALTGVAAQWVNGQLVSTLSASNFVFDTSTTARTTAGTPGNDALFGGLGDDTLTGGAGADLMVGDAGNDSLSGNAGTDLLDGGAGADAFDGGADSDAVYYTTGGGVTLILGAPVAGVTAAIAGSSADALGDTFASIERIRGTAFADTITLNSAETVITGLSGYFGNDTLTGSAGANMISGGDGDDTLLSGGGNDALLGEAGNDSLTANGVYTIATLLGGSGNDTLTGGNGVDVLQGQDGDDVINAGPGNDAAWGGANDDEIILSGSYTSGVAFGEAGEDTLTGGNGNDRLDGGADNDTLDGNEGNDILFGQSGADVVNGGGGNDLMYDADGMSGDAYTGGSGTDSLFYQTGGTFDFTAVGADSYDTSIEWVRFMAGAVTVTGTANADRFFGSTSGDTINAGGETDWLQGLGGGDVLNGEGGNDRIEGGVGSDTIRGGTGSDQLTGGNTGSTAGDGAADTFLYTVTDIGAVDRINDFEAGLDKIGLDAASFGFAAGPLAANRFMTLAAYSGGAANAISGDVFAYNAANGYLYWDADGATAGGLAVMTIFSNTANLTAGDFAFI